MSVEESQNVNTFLWPVRIYYEDTDSGGVVYYANYLKYMERARTELLRALGFEQDELIERNNVIFAVRSASIDYLAPARFNDHLVVCSEVSEVRRASLVFRQAVRRENEENLLCEAEIKIACIDSDSFKPIALPDALYRILRN